MIRSLIWFLNNGCTHTPRSLNTLRLHEGGVPCRACKRNPFCLTWQVIVDDANSRNRASHLPTQDESITFILEHPVFEDICKRAGVEVTRRQAAKFFRKSGAAWSEFVRSNLKELRCEDLR